MRSFLLSLFVSVFCFHAAQGQFTISGKVLDSARQRPVPFASLSIPVLQVATSANEKGEFIFRNLPAGTFAIQVSYLDFARRNYEVQINANDSGLLFTLEEYNLQLKEVIITAKRPASLLTTSYIIERSALDHMQMLSAADVTSLLPGGKTNRNLHLASSASQPIAVNGNSGENGNPLFGVAVEVDGVRLSNTSLPGAAGTDTRNIASTNIESIEIVTGVPSVEYGDLSNGLVKINTRKGRSPYIVEMLTKPNTKQVSLSKGIEISPEAGVININLEHTRSISDLASPYTSYARNNLSAGYSNTFRRSSGRPLFLDLSLTGNTGGYNSRSDPDLFTNTYSKAKDDVLRGNLSLKWQLNRPWITNLETAFSFNYNNRSSEVSSNQSASSSVAAIHATEEGYHVGRLYAVDPLADIILIEPGYWYQLAINENKALNYSAKVKANWSKMIGRLKNHLMVGGEWSLSGNKGKGSYYDDLRYAPTWRPYTYNTLPDIRNFAVYAENRMQIPVKQAGISLVAGLRTDITAIKGADYGTVSSLSPRLSAAYSFFENAKQKLSDLSLRFSWGKMVKLPSFGILYPQTSYQDILTFAPGTTPDGQTYYAYYTMPSRPVYNPDLDWQYTLQRELNLQGTINGVKVVITASQEDARNTYSSVNRYLPFTYKFTDQSGLEDLPIPVADRVFEVDRNTGVVTVSDRTGAYQPVSVPYKEITRAISNSMPVNGSPVVRKRISWIVDFREMPALRTRFRIDGSYYYYKGLNLQTVAYMPNSTLNMADGNPYKYIGFFTGGAVSANGSVDKALNLNFTATTHIPALRMIFSARLECSLYDYSRNLSEYANGRRGFVIDSRDDYTPSSTKSDIYAGDQFVGVYPEYYISFDDMQTRIPFAEKFLWARDNDPALYNELAKMVVRTNYNFYFNPSRLSVFYSANLGITKELGRLASLTFNATNFINNMGQVSSTQNNGSASLFGSSYIPSFYYGLSLRLKI